MMLRVCGGEDVDFVIGVGWFFYGMEESLYEMGGCLVGLGVCVVILGGTELY